MNKKLKRDVIISIAKGEELVGVYYAENDGSEVLFECHPRIADKIIELWNKEV